MTALITVHGTFASAEQPRGAKWWQLDSEFERDIRQLVTGEASQLDYIPLQWDGLNKETSRRNAALKLLDKMLQLESAGTPYAVIGHSHGGSVIALALLEACNRRSTLPGLVRWITVGTPFIALHKSAMLFSRVSYLGKSTLVTLATFLLLFTLSFYFDPISGAFNVEKLALLIAPFAAIYAVMVYFNYRAFHVHRRANWDRFKQSFTGRWIALNHHDDEAIEGLGVLGRARLKIFDERFAVPLVTFFGAIAVPIMLLVLLLSPRLMAAFEWLVGQKNRFDEAGARTFSANVEFVADRVKAGAQIFANFVHPKMEPFFALFSDPGTRFVVEGALSFVTLLVIPIMVILLAAYATIVAIGFLSIGVSFILSRLLNIVARSQIKATAYGLDAVGEIASHASKTPFWLDQFSAPRPLPADLAQELSKYSDDQAIAALPKLRGVVKSIALNEGGIADADAISQYLSGYELIHTSYFNVPRFRKLVAFVLANGRGFAETAGLRAYHGRGELEAWYESIRPSPQPLPGEPGRSPIAAGGGA